MQHHLKRLTRTVIDKLANRIARQVGESMSNSDAFADRIAYRVALETLLRDSIGDRKPNEVFSGISDGFWFWLCTEGYEREPTLRKMLPAMPAENVQLTFTDAKGHSVMREGFSAYRMFKDTYEQHIGPISSAGAILDFGCGWRRDLPRKTRPFRG
jgi:hypothetical protein